MPNLEGKKLLILGGVFQHCKLVEAAKSMGVVTYVTDFLSVEKAPAKLFADKYYNVNVFDIDEIVSLCRAEGIDGVLSTSLDACQGPYMEICSRLGLPCFGTREQFEILTNKKAFKAFCAKCGIDTIQEYTIEDFADEETCRQKVSFPVLVKPCDSRGSRGQTICYDYSEMSSAINNAASESKAGDVIIERYMGQANDFSMTLLVLNGRVYITRTVDRILGRYEDGLDRLAIGSASPSVHTNLYIEKVHPRIVEFIERLGINTAPVFMQGFVDGETIRFYDPGLRMGGSEYERVYEHVIGKNLLCPLIEFALTGNVTMVEGLADDDKVWLNGKVAAQILPALRPGKITHLQGFEEIRQNHDVVSVFQRCDRGAIIKESHNVSQRLCEIYSVCGDNISLERHVRWIYETLKVLDENGENMIVSQIPEGYYAERG